MLLTPTLRSINDLGDCYLPQDASSVVIRTPLIDGFVSRQNAADVEAKLRQENAKISVIEDSKSNEQPSRFRSPLSIRVLRVAGFTYLGIQGELLLEFVDDELYATWFFPTDVARFEVEIGKQLLTVALNQPVRLHAATELWTDVDYRGRKYWAWDDVNFRKKTECWIKRNT